jgi:hypothetical protein
VHEQTQTDHGHRLGVRQILVAFVHMDIQARLEAADFAAAALAETNAALGRCKNRRNLFHRAVTIVPA